MMVVVNRITEFPCWYRATISVCELEISDLFQFYYHYYLKL